MICWLTPEVCCRIAPGPIEALAAQTKGALSDSDQLAAAAIMAATRRLAMAGPLSSHHMIYVMWVPVTAAGRWRRLTCGF